jgi:hypothetical protein
MTTYSPLTKAILSPSQISDRGEVDSASIEQRPTFEKTPTKSREADSAGQP